MILLVWGWMLPGILVVVLKLGCCYSLFWRAAIPRSIGYHPLIDRLSAEECCLALSSTSRTVILFILFHITATYFLSPAAPAKGPLLRILAVCGNTHKTHCSLLNKLNKWMNLWGWLWSQLFCHFCFVEECIPSKPYKSFFNTRTYTCACMTAHTHTHVHTHARVQTAVKIHLPEIQMKTYNVPHKWGTAPPSPFSLSR